MPSLITIPVLSRHRHPRLRYVLKELGRDLGWRFQLMTDKDKWVIHKNDIKILYGENTGGVKSTNWPAHAYLSGSSVEAADLEVEYQEGVPVFFSTPSGNDLLACMFFLLARYEEFWEFTADAHGRFPASESHALRNGYLHRPVVREWAAVLAERILAEFPNLPAPKNRPFTFRPSYDIDLLWAWKHRGWRSPAAGLRDLLTGHPRRALQRFTTSSDDDPYNTLPFLEDLHANPGLPRAEARAWDTKPFGLKEPGESTASKTSGAQLEPIYFWLLANNEDRRDPNPYPIPDEQIAVMRQIIGQHQVGIHPGYLSSDRPELIVEEAARLQTVTGRTVQHSRQHFLRFRLPETYRSLRSSGITHDYSMGYADAVGWRAGTNLPFFWYDLEREEATGLTVHPFAAMDVTLKNYLKQSPQGAQQQVIELAELVRPFGGDFMLLWHNSSFAEEYGWAGWREMYAKLVQELIVL